MANFRADTDKCSKYNVQLCKNQKDIVFKFMDDHKKKFKRVISMKQAVSTIVLEYGKLMNIKTDDSI